MRTPCEPPVIKKFDTSILSPLYPLVLFKSLSNSNGLFSFATFQKIHSNNDGFFVQINHEETALLKMEPETIGAYRVTFLARHPDDRHLCHDKAPW